MLQPGTSLEDISTLRKVLKLSGWEAALRSIHERRQWLDRIHIELTEIPAPTFRETARAEYMAAKFRELGLQHVRMDAAGNVLGERPGSSPEFIAVTAHLDTVLSPGVQVQVKRSEGRFWAPGIADNGAGLAALLGAAAALEESKIVTGLSLLFICTVGEEGEGDLCGTRQLFSHREFCRRAKGVIVIDGASVQQTAVAGLGSRRYLVEITGPGGHSWGDFGRVNPIHALSGAIVQLNGMVLPEEPRSSLNIGVIHGGDAVNAIPHTAWMKLDIRSTDPAEIQRLSLAMEVVVREAVERENRRGSGSLETRFALIGDRPAAGLPRSARILQVIRDVDQHFGIQGRFEVASTDANIPLALGIEAITVGGGGTGGAAHTPGEWYDPNGRDLGLKRILLAALVLAGVAGE